MSEVPLYSRGIAMFLIQANPHTRQVMVPTTCPVALGRLQGYLAHEVLECWDSYEGTPVQRCLAHKKPRLASTLQ